MQMRKDEAEQVQLWISVAQQPGLGSWFNVWLVSRTWRPQPAQSAKGPATSKKLPQGACTA